MSQEYLIRHAAPTLAGLKTANLFPCAFEDRGAFCADLGAANRVLVPRGLRLLPLRWEEGRALLYLYRPDALSADLDRREARTLLRQAGYGAANPLRELTRRLQAQEGFPHEIGLFLGYPPEDVRGFLRHRGRNAKCSGCWKVYGDPEKAQETFAAYKTCTADYCARCARGATLAHLTVES